MVRRFISFCFVLAFVIFHGLILFTLSAFRQDSSGILSVVQLEL